MGVPTRQQEGAPRRSPEPDGHPVAPARRRRANETRIAADDRVPSSHERATPAMLQGGERFAAYVAHELRTPLATRRALLEPVLADPNADVAACERSVRTSSRPAGSKSACSRHVSLWPGVTAGCDGGSRSTSLRSRPKRYDPTT